MTENLLQPACSNMHNGWFHVAEFTLTYILICCILLYG